MTDSSDLPFIAHYRDGDKLVPRRFATNAEAHAFRKTLVDGALPAEPPKGEVKAPASAPNVEPAKAVDA